MQILQWVVVNPSCPVDKNNRCGYTVPRLICTFCLSVGLWMISRSEVEFHVKSFSKGTRELGDKLGAAVRGDVVRDTMIGENMNDE